jgi:O-antigen/teichoic acid export membrane protein
MNASPYSSGALKRGAAHFFIGKVFSALLSLGILFWLVRLLSVAEYGVYVTLEAAMGLALALTSFGLPWMAARYLPEFRLYAGGKRLAHFVWRLIALIGLFAGSGALLLFVAMPWLLAVMKLTQYTDVARIYLLVLVLEGLRTNIQTCILEPLLQQGQSQLSQISRNLALLLCVSVMAVQGPVSLYHVVLAELAGSFLGMASALNGLVRHLRLHRALQADDSWQPPLWPKMWSTARHMYFSYLVNMTYSAPVFIFLTQRFLGVEATALFGFILNLFGQISNYLPATLLFNLIRPKLIISYAGEGGMAQLTRNANLVGKMSLFVLMPLLVFTWLAGGELVNQLSGGKFTEAGYYLAGLLLMLIPFSQRQILETVAVASGKSHLCSWGSSLGVLVIPLAYWLLESGLGLWSPILAMVASQVLFNTTLIAAMGFTTTYRSDALGLFKMTAGALAAFGLGILVNSVWADSFLLLNGSVGWLDNAQGIISRFLARPIPMPARGWPDLIIMAAFTLSLFLLASYLFKPFRAEERERLNRLLKRNVFIW